MKTYRAQRGLTFWMALAVVIYALASVAIAVATEDSCRTPDQRWVFAPPHWECEDNLPGFG